MEKKRNLWLARTTVILFLGITLIQMITGDEAVWSAMQAAMYYGVLFFGFRFGAGSGCLAGAVCGIVETLRQDNMAPLGMFCLMGVLAGTFRRLGRGGAAAAYLCGALATGSLYAAPYLTESLPELLTACAVFFLTPESLFKTVKRHNSQGGWEEMQKHRLEETADSYGKLSRSLMNLKPGIRPPDAGQTAAAVERAAAMVCGGCRQCGIGKREEMGGGLDFERLCVCFREKGCLEPEDMPEDFRTACRRQSMYLEAVADCLGSVGYEEGWRSRFFESREAASLQFREMERTLKEMAAQLDEAADVTGEYEESVRRVLRKRRLKLEQLLVLEMAKGRREMYVTVRAEHGGCVTVKELGESMGKILSRSLRVSENGRSIVGRETCTIHLVEETPFRMLSGVARVCKEDEELSGDNFSCRTLPGGQMMLCLSDGCGSGRQAFLESQLVMELLEELLDAGFSPERAIYMLNALLLVREEEQTAATLDLALIDLYTGQAHFYKQGAVSTFIRRRNQVLQIEPGSLPMGLDCAAVPVSEAVLLEDGDMVVMVTDGVLDALAGEDKEGILCRFLEKTTQQNARELAEEVMRAGWSEDMPAKDDMTVLTAGLWKK